MMDSAFTFEDLRYETKNGIKRERKQILYGVNGSFPSGKFIGILGPSGSGKTTLLNILSGCITNYTGRIHLNLNNNQNALGYIQQDSHLCDLLSVKETFELAADLKLPNNRRSKKWILIDELMNILGLHEVANSKVGVISGGQRKRLSIGLELLSDFSVVLLDEPTSGLDITSMLIIMEYLKSLTARGKTIVTTIHQPSATILDKFDYLYILADGKCLYEGPPGRMLIVLAEYNMECPCFHNPADYIIEIASGDYGANKNSIKSKLISRYHHERLISTSQRKPSEKYLLLEEDTCEISSSGRQIQTLLKREYLKAIRNPTLTYLRLITSITNSLLICSIFWRVGSDGSKVWFNYNAILGFVLQLMTPSLMLTILTFPTEIEILKRERINNWYSVKWYYAAVTLIDLPISVIYCLNSNVIFYYFTEQPYELWRFTTFSCLGFLICIIAQSLGLLVGAIFNVVNGTFIGSALSFPLMLFAGFGMTFKDIPPYIKWIGHFSYLKYGVEGMAASVMGYNRTKLDCPNEEYCYYKDAQKFLDDMGVEGGQVGVDFCVLIGFFILLRILTYFVLEYRLTSRLKV